MLSSSNTSGNISYCSFYFLSFLFVSLLIHFIIFITHSFNLFSIHLKHLPTIQSFSCSSYMPSSFRFYFIVLLDAKSKTADLQNPFPLSHQNDLFRDTLSTYTNLTNSSPLTLAFSADHWNVTDCFHGNMQTYVRPVLTKRPGPTETLVFPPVAE